MKICLQFVSALALLTVALPVLAGGVVHDGSEKPEMLWVQSAASMGYAEGTLTLHGVPATIFFSDRPYRLYGHVSNSEFARQVEGQDKVDPPNAALSLLESEDVVVVELVHGPEVFGQGHTVSWQVRLLSGQLPERGGECSLFIDPIVAPQITD